MRGLAAGIIAFGAAVAVACGSFDSETLAGGGADGGAEVGATDAGGSPDGGSGDAGSCGEHPGPAMVRVGAFCIDSTEVTVQQYRDFVTARGADTSGQPPSCAWNSSFLPSQSQNAPGDKNKPVQGVDWCDAYAYCAWAGKRLCGKIGGGPIGPDDVRDPTKSEWGFACTGGGVTAFPYGNDYAPAKCNGKDADTSTDNAADVGSFTECVGGFPGLFDMSGNAWEWDDSCDAETGSAGCHVRGGDSYEPVSTLSCDSAVTQPRDKSEGRWGIRCCAD